jgi:ComF family protein
MWLQATGRVARGVLQLLYPSHCVLCEQWNSEDGPHGANLCARCFRAVTEDAAHVCPKCSATIGPHTNPDVGCPSCGRFTFHFDATVRLGPYGGSLKDAILRAKQRGGDMIAEEMGTAFAKAREAALRMTAFDLIVPVPLHWKHRIVRGHNQAEGLARGAAAVLGQPCRVNWVRRVRPVVQHAQPSASARQENVKGAFAATRRARFAGAAVLVVDDVMTTGSTLSELAKVLKSAGAKRVTAAILARR